MGTYDPKTLWRLTISVDLFAGTCVRCNTDLMDIGLIAERLAEPETYYCMKCAEQLTRIELAANCRAALRKENHAR